MEDSTLISLMEHHGVKPTANRILIARALSGAGRPMSMTELEERLETIDKSNVFRTLTLFRDAHLVHVLEDAGDGVRYELCHSHHDDEDDDVHVHFYCEKCHRTLCLEDIPVPPVSVPEGFESHTVSYLLKGICPDCR
ncbi:MAG: transcriptional repressor [Bacteroidales bacterium]|nr:transcriptional repressor [Bacteroidales bacterium]